MQDGIYYLHEGGAFLMVSLQVLKSSFCEQVTCLVQKATQL